MGQKMSLYDLLERRINHSGKLFWFIILYLRVDVHSCFTVLVSGKVLNRFGVNACEKQIRNIGVPQLVRSHVKIQRISDGWFILLGSSRNGTHSVFDALTIHILIVVPILSRAHGHILPKSLELRAGKRLSFTVRNHICRICLLFFCQKAVNKALGNRYISPCSRSFQDTTHWPE